MKKSRFVIAAAAVLAASPLVALATADAAPPVRNTATVISHVTIDRNDPSVGYVRAQYNCGPTSEPVHLWVSVKQDANATINQDLTTEGSGFGGVAATWVQSHPTDVTCDGKTHVQVFEVNTLEQVPPEFGGGTVGYGALQRGYGYVQFCLTIGGEEDPNGVFIADMNFQQVK